MKSLLGILFPPECIGCKQPGTQICPSCLGQLQPHSSLCPGCHRPTGYGQTCFGCTNVGKTAMDGCLIGFVYQGAIKKMIRRLKYYHRAQRADTIAQRLQRLVMDHLEQSPHPNCVIGYVPSHRYRRYRVKGYNQSLLLAQQLSARTGLPVVHVATKTRHTQSQVSLSRQSRWNNLRDVFALQESGIDDGIARRVYIVDDLTTTGATFHYLAQTIKKTHPDREVRGCAVARSGG